MNTTIAVRPGDYDNHFPSGYEAGHTAGLKLLRGRPHRAGHGRAAVGALYAALGARIFDTAADSDQPEIRQETDEALALTGKDVGTPIIQFQPPAGAAFFGPVISRLPSAAEAVPLSDHVLGLASFPGFAELKRSLRERPQLRSSGVETGQAGVQEDWYAGRRRARE